MWKIMRIFRHKKGVSPNQTAAGRRLHPREPSAFEAKLRERLNAMPRAQQYRMVAAGMAILAAFILLRAAIAIYKFWK
jgi:hypothetical protein